MSGTFRIAKVFAFEAAHRLTKVPPGHKCGQLHGHSYKVEFILESDGLDEMGFVLDYAELKPVKDYIDQHLDHKYLNEVIPYEPTAELIALFLFTEFKSLYPGLVMVAVMETANTVAVFHYNGLPKDTSGLTEAEIQWYLRLGENLEVEGNKNE